MYGIEFSPPNKELLQPLKMAQHLILLMPDWLDFVPSIIPI